MSQRTSGPTGITNQSALAGDKHGGRYASIDKGATSVRTAPTVSSVPPQVVVGSNVSTFSINLPPIAAGTIEDVAFQAPLGMSAFNLSKGVTGLIVVNLTLVQQPKPDVLVVFSQQLSYGGVSPSNTWTIPSGGSWAGGVVSGTARAFSFAGTGAQTIQVLLSAFALAIPAQGT